MGNPPLVRRGSSTSHLPQPLTSVTSNSIKSPPPPTTTTIASSDDVPPVHPSLLQPRVAVVLNVPTPWHPWLFALRLFSILPALWWGLPSAVQLLLRILPGPEIVVVVPSTTGGSVAMSVEQDARYALAETGLATIWVRMGYVDNMRQAKRAVLICWFSVLHRVIFRSSLQTV